METVPIDNRNKRIGRRLKGVTSEQMGITDINQVI